MFLRDLKFLLKGLFYPKPKTKLIGCPNCWGHQEYNGRFCDPVKEQIPLKKKGWIQAYMEEYLERKSK